MQSFHRPALALLLSVVFATAASARSNDLERLTPFERQDLGVPATAQLHDGAMHGPTPASIPGGQLVTTKGLVALGGQAQVPHVVLDALGQQETLPRALQAGWMAQAGSFDDAVQQRAAVALAQATQGRKDVALVFYCLSRECWMSYDAALRAIRAGYTNVLWYRGGLEAWKSAGLPTRSIASTAQAAASPTNARATFTLVATARAPAELRIQQTRFFAFALPPGWRVGEDGQYALTLLAPDQRALTVMVGNAGMQPNVAPARFAYDKLSALQPQDLRIGNPRTATPASGFPQAVAFDVAYRSRGVAYRGVAKVSVAPAYDTQTMVMTAALATDDQWAGHAGWLPQVADQVSATNGAAFGMRGVMSQNLANSTAYAQAARDYRDWSRKNWQGVVDQRDASQDRRNVAVRENLGSVQTYANPYGAQPVELPTTNRFYWTDRQGQVVGTDDPRADPNVGATGEWRRMELVKR